MAFYCSHIAMHTIEENENVMIYGPVIMNAEVLCYKGDLADVRTVGISQGRQNEKEQAGKIFLRQKWKSQLVLSPRRTVQKRKNRGPKTRIERHFLKRLQNQILIC